MFDEIVQSLPPSWRGPVSAVLALIAWIPAWQDRLLEMVWFAGESAGASAASRILLALPALLIVVGMWMTMLSGYTLPFRSRRSDYLRLLTMTWWDAARAVWLFWAGVARLGMVLLGWFWGALKLAFVLAGRALRQLIASPFAVLDWSSRRYFQPGVPWLAFLLILGWSALETTVFTFTLRPTLSGVLWDITGTEPNPALMTPLLFLFLFLLIAGSFACIYVLTQAVENRQPKQIVQMVIVEFFVMFFEVMFLYRELIDAITPWIAQQTNEQFRLGLWSTLALACFGWVGIRAMTWFLFGRYGTPALMAILSRDTLDVEAADAKPAFTPDTVSPAAWWGGVLAAFKKERSWFDEQAGRLVELLVLPVLQLMAAAVNFCLIVVTSQPAFSLPFESLDEAMARLPVRTTRADAQPVAGGAALDAVTEV